jgi:glyoxylase-like metal-dependent hydrolase (beta-lactamase superfamily II)
MAARARARFGGAFPTPEPAGDGLAVDLGGRTVELVATPGHSAGHTAAVDRAAGVVAAADAAMGRAIADREGNGYIPPMYAPPAAYRATLARLAALAPRVYLSGHEPVLDAGAAAAFLAASADACDRLGDLVRAALDDERRTLMALCARVHAAYGDLPVARVRDLALTVDGHLAELAAAGDAAIEPGPPRTFRRPR